MNYLKYHLPYPLYYGITIFIFSSLVFVPIFIWGKYTHPERTSLLTSCLIVIIGTMATIFLAFLQQRIASATGYQAFTKEFKEKDGIDEIEERLLHALTGRGFRVRYQQHEKGFLAETATPIQEVGPGVDKNALLRARFYKNKAKNGVNAKFIIEIKGFVITDTGESQYLQEVGESFIDAQGHITTDVKSTSQVNKGNAKLLDGLGSIFTFLVAFSGVQLILFGPAKTQAQLIYRVGLFLIGLFGLVIVHSIKRTRKRSKAESAQESSKGRKLPPPLPEHLRQPISSSSTRQEDAEKRYQVLFFGQIAETQQLTDVKKNVAKLYKVPVERCERLFTGKRIVIKNNVSYQTAQTYRTAFEKTGAICRVEEIG